MRQTLRPIGRRPHYSTPRERYAVSIKEEESPVLKPTPEQLKQRLRNQSEEQRQLKLRSRAEKTHELDQLEAIDHGQFLEDLLWI